MHLSQNYIQPVYFFKILYHVLKAVKIQLSCLHQKQAYQDPHSLLPYLTLCILGYFSCFSLCLPTSSKKFFFSKRSFRNTIRVSNGLGPDQDRRYVSPDLGPKFQTVCKSYQQITARKGF